MDYNMLSTSTLTGKSVVNYKGEDLGDVKDIVLDLESGNVAYAVISYGGFLGIGDKYFAVPWDALHLENDDKIVLNVDKETMENSPGFDKDHWPSSPNREFVSQVHEHYGYKPYWEKNEENLNKDDVFITESPETTGKESGSWNKDTSTSGSEGRRPPMEKSGSERGTGEKDEKSIYWGKIGDDIDGQNESIDNDHLNRGSINRPENKNELGTGTDNPSLERNFRMRENEIFNDPGNKDQDMGGRTGNSILDNEGGPRNESRLGGTNRNIESDELDEIERSRKNAGEGYQNQPFNKNKTSDSSSDLDDKDDKY
jgi:sporulation protein YlmC with PRC-barrel domain